MLIAEGWARKVPVANRTVCQFAGQIGPTTCPLKSLSENAEGQVGDSPSGSLSAPPTLLY